MKKLFAKSAALASTLLLSSVAHAVSIGIDDGVMFGINFTGSGDVADAQAMTYLDYDGYSYIVADYAAGSDPLALEVGDPIYDSGVMTAVSGDLEGTTVEFGDMYVAAVFDDWVGTYTALDQPLITGDTIDLYEWTTGTVLFEIMDNDGTEGDATDDTVFQTLLTAEIREGAGYQINDSAGVTEIVLAITDVADDTMYVDLNGDGVLTEEEDLYELLMAALADGEELYLGYTLATNGSFIDQPFLDALNQALGTSYEYPYINTLTNDGTFYIAVVPEPGMLSLMGLAFLGLAGFQRRRKHS